MAEFRKEKEKKPFDNFKLPDVGTLEQDEGDTSELVKDMERELGISSHGDSMETNEKVSNLFMKATFLLFEQAIRDGRVETVSKEEFDQALADAETSARNFMNRRRGVSR